MSSLKKDTSKTTIDVKATFIHSQPARFTLQCTMDRSNHKELNRKEIQKWQKCTAWGVQTGRRWKREGLREKAMCLCLCSHVWGKSRTGWATGGDPKVDNSHIGHNYRFKPQLKLSTSCFPKMAHPLTLPWSIFHPHTHTSRPTRTLIARLRRTRRSVSASCSQSQSQYPSCACRCP